MPPSPVPAPVAEYLKRHALGSAAVLPLTGDASDRRYFRIAPRGAAPFVLAVYAAPFDYRSAPFVNVAELFGAMPVPVPRILGESTDVGVLALDDLGDVTLQSHIGNGSPAVHGDLYRRAVALIDTIQRRGRDLADPKYVPYRLAFDVEKLMWEMEFFLTHFVEGHRGVRLLPAARARLVAALLPICAELSAEPRVVCHRDYHSRNLMVRDHELYIIDFQDARMGPDTYDLVSLLRDCYVELPADMIDALIAEYLALGGRLGEAAEFRRRFDLMSVERHLKALGTFGFQASVKQNPAYLADVPRTLGYLRENLSKYDRFAELRTGLGASIEELRA